MAYDSNIPSEKLEAAGKKFQQELLEVRKRFVEECNKIVQDEDYTIVYPFKDNESAYAREMNDLHDFMQDVTMSILERTFGCSCERGMEMNIKDNQGNNTSRYYSFWEDYIEDDGL
jgi:hypothetical protein